MATATQRLQAIADALLNRPATPAQVSRLADAIGKRTLGDGFAALTNAQRAQHCVEYLRGHVISLVKGADVAAASAKALSDASAAVDSEFAEG